MEKVNLQKRVRGISTYTNVINTKFTEFVVPDPPQSEEPVSVERFFELYEELFFDIPAEGSRNSHQYLVLRSSQYLGGQTLDPEKEALIEEINSLRQQILEIGDTYLTINNIVR